MEECLCRSVFDVTANAKLNPNCVQMWLRKSESEPGATAGSRWRESAGADPPWWPTTPADFWMKVFKVESILGFCFLVSFQLSCAPYWIFFYKQEETFPRGKFCLWKSTEYKPTAGVVKVALCFASKKGLQQINQCETQFARGGALFWSWTTIWPSGTCGCSAVRRAKRKVSGVNSLLGSY